jgi:hypothetical protein
MKPVLLFSLLVLLSFTLPSLAEEREIPFHLPIPDGWGTETIPFPLDFAPELDYEGFEELRFAPGMFKPQEEDFWTCVSVWWVPNSTTINPESLQKDLDGYYQGLAQAVAVDKEYQSEIPATRSRIKAVIGHEGAPLLFQGTIDPFDSFVTVKPVAFNLRAEMINCSSTDQMAVYFEHVANKLSLKEMPCIPQYSESWSRPCWSVLS